MRFDVLTLFPELIQSHLDFSIMKRAKTEGIIEVNSVNPRDFTLDKHKKVDDTPYGGGAGMVLMPQPYVDCYESIEKIKLNTRHYAKRQITFFKKLNPRKLMPNDVSILAKKVIGEN